MSTKNANDLKPGDQILITHLVQKVVLLNDGTTEATLGDGSVATFAATDTVTVGD